MNISDLYSTRIQKTFDDDQVDILALLRANLNKQVKLINYYNGLPVSYTATIAAVDRNTLDLDVQPEQAYVMEQIRSVFIRSPLLSHDVFAHVQYVNVRKGAATLTKLCYVEIMAEHRNFLRMAPIPSPRAEITAPHCSCQGVLHDLSLSGVNIAVHEPFPLEPGSDALVSFTLAALEKCPSVSVSAPARLVAISGDALPRNYRFAITADKNLEQYLSQYIIQRQIEIIRQIKDAVS